MSLTEAGVRLSESITPLFEQINAELDALGELRDKPKGTIRLTCTDDQIQLHLRPMLANFLRDYPEIQLELYVDYGFTNLVEERFDAGIRLGESISKDMIAVRIGPDWRLVVVGSPDYFERHSAPQTPDKLTEHSCINIRHRVAGSIYAWEFEKGNRELKVRVEGQLPAGVTAKDIVLAVIGKIGTAGGNGHALEFAGSAIRDLSLEGRMTICNMSIEAGARVGLVAVDEKTIAYVKGRPFAPKGADWAAAVAQWQDLVSDADAHFDTVVELRAEDIKPQVSWGTSPEMVLAVDQNVPDPAAESDPVKKDSITRALKYMGLQANQAITDIQLDRVFIGSCTNSRIEDLRAAAEVAKGRKVASTIKQAMVVPGSGLVKAQAEQEGLHHIFIEAGFEWREPGCSMCLAMNPDKLGSGEHCASTSNRNFEGRQGAGGRTHLVSPAMAAAAAVTGRFIDVRELIQA